MSSYIFHLNLYDLAMLGAIFIGLTFSLLLIFRKSTNSTSNGFLALVTVAMVLGMSGTLGADLGIHTRLFYPDWLSIQFPMAIGPLVYFYVLKITRPTHKIGWKNLLRFLPLLLQQAVFIPGIVKDFDQLKPLLLLLAFSTISVYLYLSYRIIPRFQQYKKNNVTDRRRHELWRLRRLLVKLAVLWLLWIPCGAVAYFRHNNSLEGLSAYHPAYLLLGAIIIWISVVAISWPEVGLPALAPTVPKPPLSAELAQKGAWLKSAMKGELFYQDAELTLSSLAVKLGINTHELSRIINTVIKKNFNDFINEYRVRDVILKMQDPAYDHITLLGIAFESGFNSKSTFNRIFRQMTGKSPVEYKADLNKERPTYNLGRQPRLAPITLNYETTAVWSQGKLNRSTMLKNYLRIAWRALIRSKGYATINITGLAIGITCAGLIFLWVADEISYDNMNLKKDRLYQIELNANFSGNRFVMGSTPSVMGKTIKTEIPGIANVCRISDQDVKALFRIGDKSLYANGRYADPALFSMFTLPFIKGNAANVFSQLRSIVLTEKTAQKFFGNDEDVVGKTVRMDNKNDYLVTGVLKDIPENSTLQAEWFIPYTTLSHDIDMITGNDQKDHAWNIYGPITYVELEPNANLNRINAKLYNFIHRKDRTETNTAFLYPMARWHLYNQFTNGKEDGSGNIDQVRLLSIIAWVILLIACINFMNLTTALSEKRSKEIGVRKVLGSGRKRLILQFITESILMSAIATTIAVGLIMLALPAFNTLAGKDLTIGLGNPIHLLALLLITLVCGLLAGSYPSFYLSSFDPVKILKGLRIKSGSATMIRKGLVVLQFTVSVVFIISTIVIYEQIQHAKSRDMGFDKNNLVEIDMQRPIGQTFFMIKQELINTGAVVNAALTDHVALYDGNTDNRYTWEGSDPNNKTGLTVRNVTPEFMSTVGMHIIAGRDFRAEAADTASVIVTQSLAKLIDKNDVVGKVIRAPNDLIQGAFKNLRIIGVVQDYVLGNVYDHVGVPVIFICNSPIGADRPMSLFNDHFLYLRIKDKQATQQTLATISSIIQKNNPTYPFQFRFVDDQFNEEFKSEVKTSSMSSIFATLAIIISCLGLFSLAAYAAEKRIKEIGIRKVLGASVQSLAGLLSKSFLQLVGISCLIAFPIAWYIMHQWLQNYQYRISIHWWIFAIAGIVAMLIALLTISFQALKAALMNPVKSLRSE